MIRCGTLLCKWLSCKVNWMWSATLQVRAEYRPGGHSTNIASVYEALYCKPKSFIVDRCDLIRPIFETTETIAQCNNTLISQKLVSNPLRTVITEIFAFKTAPLRAGQYAAENLHASKMSSSLLMVTHPSTNQYWPVPCTSHYLVRPPST